MTTHLRRVLLLLLTSLTLSAVALADGGMWLLEQMADHADELRAKGLQIPVEEIYNPDGPCLQRAVVMFDGGCSGVFVSNQGLVLTNHHCGYDQIQSHSAVEHNYLRDGIWTQSMREELPCPGLEVISIDKITNVTDQVNKLLKESPYKEDPMAAFSIATLTKMIPAIVGEEAMRQPGIRYELKPFYGGNRYYLFTKKVFTDVRLVAAPPSAIGKYGSDTDNWMWPRHTGDFSIFRVYVDKNNNPADYSADNVPYKPERFAAVSTSGVQRDDFALIMGFPGTTNHFFTEAQVDEWSEIDNNIRIEMRGLRQEVMLRRMLADEKVNIQYAAKYAYSQNGYKRAQGANWAIRTRNLQATKRAQQDELAQWAKANNRPEVTKAIQTIADCVAARREARRVQWYLMEGILTPIEFLQIPLADGKKLQQWSDPKVREEIISELRSGYAAFYNKDYDPAVDKEVATVLLQRYTERIDEAHWPVALREGVAQYGSVQAYVTHLFDSSIFADPARFEAFLKTPSREQLLNDPMTQFAVSTINLFVQPGTPEEPKGHYIFDKPEPLWNFGHGKSYTTFDYVDCALSDTLLVASDTLKVSVTIKNTGRRDGKEVVQLYVRDKVSTVATPIQQLKAFQKVLIKPGESQCVELSLPIAELALYNAKMEEVVEPGDFEIQIGAASDDIRFKKTITIN